MKIAIIAILFALYSVHAELPACEKQDGNWSKWLRWGPCSASCGDGMQIRHRYCDNPIPKYGGAKCDDQKSKKTRKCNLGPCPVEGVLATKYGQCSRPCGGGKRLVSYVCSAPKDTKDATCFMNNCQTKTDTVEKCNTKGCEAPTRDVCKRCKRDADIAAKDHEDSDFPGNACKISTGICKNLRGGIKDMYPSNDWFFLHCSNDGPWCKPCAERFLVYNPKCGQCEKSRNGPCTGPRKWLGQGKKNDETVQNILDDENLW